MTELFYFDLILFSLPQRDSNSQIPSSPTEPSSAGTERGFQAPATKKPARRRSFLLMPPPATPVLFRDADDIHLSPVPATPPLSRKAREKDSDDIELDLESLGLTDKEIKPEYITKGEKIGSGGFKE